MVNRLKEVRLEKRMTQEELAEKSSVSRPTIVSIERNEANDVKASTMLKLATALDVSVDTIFF